MENRNASWEASIPVWIFAADGGYACILGTSNGDRYERLHNPKPDSIDVLPTRVLKEPATDSLVSEIFTISKAGHQRERGLSWIRPTGLRL